ncbi:MAG: RNA-binding S4 domain-containing protein [Gammaproteobacteria bacterium]|nr:RNA-binding S4 domain-containing protein [Gammaproteobacteria bacterium]
MDTQRIDKWLWCARFFKTRSLAADAVRGGRALINGQRVKPARTLQPGDTVTVRNPPFEQELTVVALAPSRRSATQARTLYEESPASLARRESLKLQLDAQPQPLRQSEGKLSKRDRRSFEKIRRGQ